MADESEVLPDPAPAPVVPDPQADPSAPVEPQTAEPAPAPVADDGDAVADAPAEPASEPEPAAESVSVEATPAAEDATAPPPVLINAPDPRNPAQAANHALRTHLLDIRHFLSTFAHEPEDDLKEIVAFLKARF